MPELQEVRVDGALLGELQSVAAKQNKSVDEVVNDALSSYLRDTAWVEMLDEARERTQRLGIREEDVEDLIAQDRQERARGV